MSNIFACYRRSSCVRLIGNSGTIGDKLLHFCRQHLIDHTVISTFPYLSAAFAGGISDDCLIDAPTEECTDYVEGVEAIAGLKDKTKYSKSIIAASEKRIAASVKPISLGSSTSSDSNSAEVTASLFSALDTAKKITEKFGITSSEAKLAWETVEEMAASGTSEATKKALDMDECDVDYSAACAALEELDRVLNLNDKAIA